MSLLAAFWATTGHPDLDALAYFDRAGLSLSATYTGSRYDAGGTLVTTSYSGQHLLATVSRLCKRLKHTLVDGAALWDLLYAMLPLAGTTQQNVTASLRGASAGLGDGTSYQADGFGLRLLGTGQNQVLLPVLDTDLPLDSNHLCVYVTRDQPTPAVVVDMGTADGGQIYFDLLAMLDATGGPADGFAFFENSAGGMVSGRVNTPLGHTLGTRTAANLASLYKNGQQLAQSSAANERYPRYGGQGISVALGNRRGDAGNFPSQRTFAWASVGLGMTQAQAAAYYAIVQHFQTSLYRQV